MTNKWTELTIDDYKLTQLPDIQIDYGPFTTTTRNLGRNGWFAQYRYNCWSGNSRIKFSPVKDKNGKMIITFKWNRGLYAPWGQRLTDQILWEEFSRLVNSAKINVQSSVSMRTAKEVVNHIGEEKILKAINDLSKERVGDFKPLVLDEPVPYGRNWWKEDQKVSS